MLWGLREGRKARNAMTTRRIIRDSFLLICLGQRPMLGSQESLETAPNEACKVVQQ